MGMYRQTGHDLSLDGAVQVLLSLILDVSHSLVTCLQQHHLLSETSTTPSPIPHPSPPPLLLSSALYIMSPPLLSQFAAGNKLMVQTKSVAENGKAQTCEI